MRMWWVQRVTWAGIVLGLVGSLSSPVLGGELVDETLRRLTGDAFRVHKTPHFRIAYDTSIEILEPLVDRIEGTHEAVTRFCDAMKIETEPASGPYGVIIFARYADYVAFLDRIEIAETSAAGIYDPVTKLAVFCHATDTPLLKPLSDQIEEMAHRLDEVSRKKDRDPSMRKRQERLLLSLTELRAKRAELVNASGRFVIQHEVAHQVLYGYGVHGDGAGDSAFLAEGLACLFEADSLSARPWALRVNQSRLADFREAIGAAVGARAFSLDDRNKLMEAGKLVPLSDLIARPAVMDSRGGFARYRYAQAWALIYDLIRHQPEEFTRYLRSLRTPVETRQAGAPAPLAEFEKLFGKVDSGYELAWFRRMLDLRLEPL